MHIGSFLKQLTGANSKYNYLFCRDVLIITFLDTFTSVLAGVTIFCVIGNIMERQGVDFNQLEGVEGTSLVFILVK